MELLEILRRPLITEKASLLQGLRQYSFEVDRRAGKHEIRQAVEKAFKVKVTTVRTITVPGKARRFGKGVHRAPSWKKAIVTLGPGDKIELFEGA